MPHIRERSVLFADLRGSTSLFESLGNAEATAVVTQSVALMRHAVQRAGGNTVKTLGDGLMAVFDDPAQAIAAAITMHDSLDMLLAQGRVNNQVAQQHALKMQVAITCGEVVEIAGDCFGDAVNVASRLLDHAGDNETLVSDEARAHLSPALQQRLRTLKGINVRGRLEPVHVHVLESHAAPGDMAATQFGAPEFVSPSTDGIRLIWLDLDHVFDTAQAPIVLGRSTQAAFCITDGRVSRQHARLDWHAGSFTVTDLSFNGTFVRFAGSTEVLALRRNGCTLHGSGVIGLGSSPALLDAPVVRFEILHFAETQPHQS